MKTRRIHAKMKTGGIITLMYNKDSCKVCGTYMTFVSLCEVCEEQISWMCSKCDKMYDVTHAHNVLVLK